MRLFGLSITRASVPNGGSRPKNISFRSILQAAKTGRTEASWDTNPTSADMIVLLNWRALVARARNAALDNDYAKKYLSMCKNNIVGTKGIALLPQIEDPNGDPDQLAGDAIVSGWDEFSKKGNFDVTGGMSRVDFEKLLIGTVATDGEAIVEKVYGPDAGPWGFALQALDTTLLDPSHNEVLRSGNIIRHGIEFNAFWRPVAYHFRNTMPEQLDLVQVMGQRYRRVEAKNIIHIFSRELVNQKRGLPWMRTALWRLRMLKMFEDAALVNAQVGAAKMGFFRNKDGDEVDEDDLPMDAEPGVFENIGTRELVQWNPQFPEAFISQFCAEQKRGASSGLDVSYNNLASDLPAVNFSSIRQGALDEREMWKGLQEWFANSFSRDVYDSWLEVALLSQRLTVNGRPLKFERLEKYKKVSFQGRRWAWIDPSAEVSAHEKALGLGIESRTQVIRDNGGEAYETFKEIASERADMKALGLDPDIHQAGAAQKAKTAPSSSE